jgi:predicted LPLAT superfamily acyltransferase
MRLCAIVPSYNHWQVVGAVTKRLRGLGLAVFVIDDGSTEPASSSIAALDDPAGGIVVHRLPGNQGKGAAVTAGFRLALEAGFTHAVQVDADGQHDLDTLPALLTLARAYPTALITGQPVYDATISFGRKVGRWITHIFVWIETMSLQITDSMCGFRVYPLLAVRDLLATGGLGTHMAFDPEIMVRLFWHGTKVMNVPVRVTYPSDNTSNFDLWRDNLRISRMHARLLAGMLTRLPRLLLPRMYSLHRPSTPPAVCTQINPEQACPEIPFVGQAAKTHSVHHWASLSERGALLGLNACALSYRVLGRRACLVVLAPVVAWFFVTGREQRAASHSYLSRILGRRATLAEGYRHFFTFATRALDTLIAWDGGIPRTAVTASDAPALDAAVANPNGALVVVAHLGNVDLARALLDRTTRDRLTVLVHTRHAANYNRVLRRFCPDASLNLIEVGEIGPDTAIDLRERVGRGEWVVIAGDRTPVGSSGRVMRVPFLGADAAFSQGPWILAALLGCSVQLLFCLSQGNGWRLTLEPFAERIVLPRHDRSAALQTYAARYAARLEVFARQAPFQWNNFFDFWSV